ncbi:MAG TPA: PQQ-binding-like beta-propeller repeat protein [Pirellulales bacterium]|nr:PQQ-binding-like beta-propeller repeat protein [Pirellulales bacterium]
MCWFSNRLFSTATLIALAGAVSAAAGDWDAFRGTARNGRSTESNVPLVWGPENNIRWKVPLPGTGNSSPVVAAGHVYVTCASDEGRGRGTYCYDRRDGRLLWSDVVAYEPEDPTHGTNPYCGSSPAADERHVVVWHGSAGVHCYDHAGRKLWSRDLGTFRHIWGYGSSPVLFGESVLLNCGPGPRQCVTAIDRATGKTRWQFDVPGGDSGEESPAASEKPAWTGSWATPVVATVEGREQVIVPLAGRLHAFDPQSGAVLWTIDGLGPLVYTDALMGSDPSGGGVGVAMSGYHGPAIGFRTGGSGDMTDTNRLWRATSRIPQRIGSGVLIDGRVYMANEIGVAQCIDAMTGEELWHDRLPATKIWASIIENQGRLFVTDQQGKTIIFAANPERFELVGENEVGEGTNSTLAFSDGAAFLRTFQSLICISPPGE